MCWAVALALASAVSFVAQSSLSDRTVVESSMPQLPFPASFVCLSQFGPPLSREVSSSGVTRLKSRHVISGS